MIRMRFMVDSRDGQYVEQIRDCSRPFRLNHRFTSCIQSYPCLARQAKDYSPNNPVFFVFYSQRLRVWRGSALTQSVRPD